MARLAVFLFACLSALPAMADAAQTISATSSLVSRVGRTYQVDQAVGFSWLGAGVQVLTSSDHEFHKANRNSQLPFTQVQHTGHVLRATFAPTKVPFKIAVFQNGRKYKKKTVGVFPFLRVGQTTRADTCRGRA
jgi:hypothetical protein